MAWGWYFLPNFGDPITAEIHLSLNIVKWSRNIQQSPRMGHCFIVPLLSSCAETNCIILHSERAHPAGTAVFDSQTSRYWRRSPVTEITLFPPERHSRHHRHRLLEMNVGVRFPLPFPPLLLPLPVLPPAPPFLASPHSSLPPFSIPHLSLSHPLLSFPFPFFWPTLTP